MRNESGLDRVGRFVFGLAFLILVFAVHGTVAVVYAVVAGILMLTGLVGFCPLYLPFRFSTRKH